MAGPIPTNSAPQRPADAQQRPADPNLASKARAEARLREIRASGVDLSEARDKFYAPPPPDSWSYEWKVKTVMGQEDPTQQVELVRAGWEPVPLSRHPEMMPPGWKGATIEVGGLVLMERPLVLTQEAQMRDRRAAREAIATKEAQMRSGRPSDLGPREVHRFNKSREAMPIPRDE